jgi:amino acid adenylation domain-containing protein
MKVTAADIPSEGYPVSARQARLLPCAPGRSAGPFRVRGAILISGRLDTVLLKAALQMVLDRHEVLRTTFHYSGAGLGPLQVINEELLFFELERFDEHALPLEEKIDRLFEESARASLHLEKGPGVHLTLTALEKDKHLLVIALPAACADATTLDLFANELRDWYRACAQRTSPGPVPIQHADFAAWEAELGSSAKAMEGRRFWEEKHAGNRLSPVFEKAGSKAHFTPRTVPVSFSAEVVRALDDFAQRRGTTAEMALLSAWHFILARSSRAQHFGVGWAVNARNCPELQAAFGPYTDYLPIRAFADPEISFQSLAAAMQRACGEARQYQDFFALSQEGFVFPDYAFDYREESGAFDAGEISFEICRRQSCVAPFRLKLSCWRRHDRVTAELHYDAGQLDRVQVELLRDRFEKFLRHGFAQPDERVGRLGWRGDRERRKVLAEFSQGNVVTAAAGSVVCWFETQASQAPDRAAVTHSSGALTYRELNRRANQLARVLRELGVCPGTPVGLCVPRSPEMLVGILGILKAGGAYVPLDPAYPRARIDTMLRESNAPVVLTKKSFQHHDAAFAGTVLDLERDWARIAAHSPENLAGSIFPDHPAYVIFTSGSTGTPKGVMISHGNLASSTAARFEFYRDPVRNYLLLSSFAFDSSVAGIFWTLCTGGNLVLPGENNAQAPSELIRLISRHEVSHLLGLPSLYELLLDQAREGGLESLRTVIVAGESCPARLVALHRGVLPNARLYNEYGPTEATVWCAAAELINPDAPVTIGNPIPGASVYLLDENMEPAPIGVPGEIWVGGEGVARGYLNRPELTAARFVANPFSEKPGERLYRTGDLARFLPDGSIEFLGRTDHQVKVRGFRIELEEIQAVLGRHPAVRESAVVLVDDEPGKGRIVAYVAGSGEGISSPALRDFLKGQLPEYMVPAAFVFLEKLPLTPNGKVDRHALPPPESVREIRAEDCVSARTPEEKGLVEIWEQLLGISPVGIHDNFFEHGGHSLLAMQILPRVRQILGVELPLREIFDAPTPAGLAERVRRLRGSDRPDAAGKMQRVPRDQPLPLSSGQQRLWFHWRLHPGDCSYNIPLALRLKGWLDTEALRATFEWLRARHEPLRTIFTETAAGPAQMIVPGHSLDFPIIDLSSVPVENREREAMQIAREEARTPFDLAQGPLFRVRLLRVEDREHLLLVSMHHIISDGWSVQLLMRELAEGYASFLNGEAPGRSAPPLQGADFAFWERRWMLGSEIERQLAYWKRQLADPPGLLELPMARHRGGKPEFAGACEPFVFPEELSTALEEFTRRHGGTLFMTLAAAFQALLHRYTGEEDLLLGVPVANRSSIETESMLGFFANTLVLRTRFDGDPTSATLLEQVRRNMLDGHAHQNLPFDKIVEELKPERDPARPPFFNVMLAMNDLPSEGIALPELAVETVDVDTATAKFDLTLYFIETSEGLRGRMEYSTALFEAPDIRRMLGHLQTLLQGFIARPDEPISRLPLLGADESHRLLVEWSDTATAYPRDTTIHELFSAQAAKTPEAHALQFGDQTWTYRELDERSNRVADLLIRAGVRGEMPVAVAAERSPQVIACLLGILKAGGAYLPLDPSYPEDRLRLMLEEAAPAVIITERKFANKLAVQPARNGTRRELIFLDEKTLATGVPQANVAQSSRTSAESLAYVMYTSGSTGRPKGVSVTHRGVVRLVKETHYARFGADEVFLLLAPLSFDATTFEIWGPLLNGGKLAIMPPETPTLEEIGAAIRRYHVTTLWLTAGLFHLMVDHRLEDLLPLRQLLAGGDALSLAHVRKLLDRAPDLRLINGYGPTENTTFTCCAELTRELIADGTVPIGRPISNTQVYVLDAQMQPVPIGVPGELYIGGDGLARDYLKQPVLTAESFVANPFDPATRLYKTGDRVRYRADGNLEFLGRLDQQVKIRGFRIEPGEIETVLCEHPAVRESAVIAIEHGGGKQLVGYVVAEAGGSIDAPALLEFLRTRLPEYMIPALLVPLPALPLNPNGKVDRRAMPAPEWQQQSLQHAPAEPATLTEERLCEIWKAVLEIGQLSVSDNFFHLGGHSLLATQIISRIRDLFGLELPLRQLFETPTVQGLAAAIDRQLEAQKADGAELDEMLSRFSREELDLLLAEISAGEKDRK